MRGKSYDLKEVSRLSMQIDKAKEKSKNHILNDSTGKKFKALAVNDNPI